MASLTIRGLEDELKQRLRIRAARHGRSMEDEARVILRHAAGVEDRDKTIAAARTASPSHVAREQVAWNAVGSTISGKHILLVIGGGIAAYKSLDLIRRLKERGARMRCILSKAAQEFVTPLSVGAIVGERAFTDL